MKKVVAKLALVGTTALFSTGALAWGLSWESFSGMGNETIEPAAYNIEVNGNNLRVYEWITPTEPRQKCVFVASERNTDFQCDVVDVDSIKQEE